MTKDSTPHKIIEFQPDALEIKNERLPFAVRFCVWSPIILLLAAILWAYLAKVDVVVQANGKLVTDEPTIVMKPLERSVIRKINVRIGDIVKKDQPLITFDPTINNADAERLKNEIDALTAQLIRLRAEFDGILYLGGPNQFEKWQLAIFKQRQEYYREKMNYYAEALLQLDASEKNKKDSLAKQKERLKEVLRLEVMYKQLHSKNAASLKDLIQMSMDRMSMEATVDSLSNDILELNHKKGTTQAEKNAFIQEWRNKISEDMVTAERDLTKNLKEYDQVVQLVKYVYLRAPCDAVVHEISSFSPGSAVREAEALITLVPMTGHIELEAEIRPQDIGRVVIGSNARIKLTAYPFQKHGTLDGVVRNISEDTLQKEKNDGNTYYYRTRITVSGKLEQVKKSFRLIPGMEATAEIKCGERRVIEYILYPLIKALDETAREP